MKLKDNKVLLVGLGVLGGGEALAKFLIKQGAKLTITDIKNKEVLGPVVRRIGHKKADFVLGKHRKVDFKKNDIIVFNPSVGIFSPWVALAKKNKKRVENDLTLFLAVLDNKKPGKNYIAVTGTRGKTTTTTWVNHFLEGSVAGGNIPSRGLFQVIDKKNTPLVLELSSFQLEFMQKNLAGPHVAIITNMHIDHLNRHRTFKNYLRTKTKIFLNQTKNDFLILNADNVHTKEIVNYKPKSKIYYFSLKRLSRNKSGLFLDHSDIYFQEKGMKKNICPMPYFAKHQRSNLLASLLGSYLYRRNWSELIGKIKSLPPVPFRQQVVYNHKGLEIINDTAATSPDAAIAALESFEKTGKRIILVTGGTDKNLEFKELAAKIKRSIKKEDLFFIEGSATIKMIQDLKNIGYFKGERVHVFPSLQEIFGAIPWEKIDSSIILFSPASASFEKFKNEFDRGRVFNGLVKKMKIHGGRRAFSK